MADKKVLNNLDMTNNTLVNIRDAVSNQEPVSLAQLNAAIEGRKNKNAVRVTATANITLSGTQTIDGVAVVAGDRVGVVGQTTAANNGIYVVAAGAWARATDANIATEVENMEFSTLEGTSNAGKKYLNTNGIGTVTLGTTALTFIVSGSGGTSYTAGNGITITGSVIAADPAVVVRKAAANIGNGTDTSIVVTHSLNTTDVDVTVIEISTKKAVEVDWEATSTSTVTLIFSSAPSTNQYRVFVEG